MELTTGLALVLGAFSTVITVVSFNFSVRNYIELQAMKKSTHTMVPIGGPTQELADLEKQLKEAMGGVVPDRDAMNRDMFHAGADPDDLV